MNAAGWYRASWLALHAQFALRTPARAARWARTHALCWVTSWACAIVVAAHPRAVAAQTTSGVDAVVVRPALDSLGLLSVDSGRVLSARDLSWKVLAHYGRAPVALAVPGIGARANDTGTDAVLRDVGLVHFGFALALSERLTVGLDAAAYRTRLGAGYGKRARYSSAGPVGASTGLIALRPLSNIDPSGGYLEDGLAGPLDVRVAAKWRLVARTRWFAALLTTLSLPFGEDEMLLGDRTMVMEPKLAVEVALASRLAAFANAGLRLRGRTILESFDTQAQGATAADARVFLDVGSEAVLALGARWQVHPRMALVAEGTTLLSLPPSFDVSGCTRYNGQRCATLTRADYFAGQTRGDRIWQGSVGAQWRISASVAVVVAAGGAFGGARSESARATLGVVWQPTSDTLLSLSDADQDGIANGKDSCVAEPEDRDGYADTDGCPDPDNDADGVLDRDDQCPDEPEDRDGMADLDGCPDRDNDGDAVPDIQDRCPDQKEDADGFEDDDGCPEDDNDHDGLLDAQDKCPNEGETYNGHADDDGCPETRGGVEIEERSDRFLVRGANFVWKGAVLGNSGKQALHVLAPLLKKRKLTLRVEVHVPASGSAAMAASSAASQKRDKDLAQRRALYIVDYLVRRGVPAAQVVPLGLGSTQPLPHVLATDVANARVEFIKGSKAP